MKRIFQTQGTCARAIAFDVDETTGIINEVQFVGGCSGNTSGVSSLVKGMKVDDVIEKLQGITCGNKPTSCPDQLAKALREAFGK